MGARRAAAELPAHRRHRRRAEPGGPETGARRFGHRPVHRRHAARRSGRDGLGARHAPAGGRPRRAQHRGVPYRERGAVHRTARTRGARHRLGEAGGRGRRRDPAARPRGAAGGGQAARRRRVRGPAVHQRRPGPGPAPGAGGLRGGHAARAPIGSGLGYATRTTSR